MDVPRLVAALVLTLGAASSSAKPPADPLAARLAGPMLSVARLITEEKLSPQVDNLIQRAPPAQILGDRWNASHPAWPKARESFTKRIAAVADAYGRTGELEQNLDAQLGTLSAPDAQALASALNGPAGGAILREQASMEFVTAVMADDPEGPKIGDPAWHTGLRALRTRFNEQVGSNLAVFDDREAILKEIAAAVDGGR